MDVAKDDVRVRGQLDEVFTNAAMPVVIGQEGDLPVSISQHGLGDLGVVIASRSPCVAANLWFYFPVLWNPGRDIIGAHTMGGEDRNGIIWTGFVCVEPGKVVKPVVLGPGQELEVEQVISIL